MTERSEGALATGGTPSIDVAVPEPPPATPLDLWDEPGPGAPRKALLLAIAAGIGVDVALRAGGVGMATAVLPIALAALLIAAGATPMWQAKVSLLPVALLAPWLAIRANPTVQTLDVLACAGCLAVAVSFGVLGGARPARGTGRVGRLVDVAAGMLDAVRFGGQGIRQAAGDPTGSTVRSVARGLALAAPIAVGVGALLADADRSFAALFGANGAGEALTHLLLVSFGAVVFLGLVRSGHSQRTPTRWRHALVGELEAIVVVSALVVLYALFAVTRLLQIGDGAREPGPDAGDGHLTALADEARAGFFQLVAVVIITVLVLVAVRLTVVTVGRRLVALAMTAVGLTLVIVGVAIHRLLRYRDEFGLTQLRLGTTWVSVWLGVVVVVAGLSFVGRVASRWLLCAVLASGLAMLVGWNAANPDATIARTNIARAVEGKRFDPQFLGAMSADAIPEIVADLDRLQPEHRDAVLARLCLDADPDPGGGLAWNHAEQRAAESLERLCGD